MLFVKYLRDGVRSGEITTSVRVWQRPHVRAGNRYRMEDGQIEIDSIVPMTFDDITPDLARACGFNDVADCSKWRNTAQARMFISFGSTTSRPSVHSRVVLPHNDRAASRGQLAADHCAAVSGSAARFRLAFEERRVARFVSVRRLTRSCAGRRPSAGRAVARLFHTACADEAWGR